jgi:hypothetical protein
MSSQLIDQTLKSATAKPTVEGQLCPTCHRALPIRAPIRDERPAEWICEECQAPLSGVLVPESAAELGRHLRLAEKHFNAGRTEPISAALRQLVESLLVRRRLKRDNHHRRRNPRVPCDLDAVVVGLNDEWLPSRNPVRAVVIDLAAHGLGIMTSQSVHGERFAIQIDCPTGKVQLLGQRSWSNFVGDCFQNTGIEFFARLGRTAISHDGPIG